MFILRNEGLAANPASISKSVPVSDLCVRRLPRPGRGVGVHPERLGVFGSPNLSPFNSNASTRNLTSFVDALDAASSISPLSATLTKNTGGWGGAPSFSAYSVPSALKSIRALPSTDPLNAPRSLSSLPFDFRLSTVNLLSPISFRIRTYAKCSRNPFRMNTSKTKDLKPCRINTSIKRGRGPRKSSSVTPRRR